MSYIHVKTLCRAPGGPCCPFGVSCMGRASEVAKTLNVSVRTIQRIKTRAKKKEVSCEHLPSCWNQRPLL